MNAREAYILSSPRGQYYESIRLAASEGKRQHTFNLLTEEYLKLSDRDKLTCELNMWLGLIEDFKSSGYKVTFVKEESLITQIIVDWSEPFAGDKGLDEGLWNTIKRELFEINRVNNPILGSAVEQTVRSILENQIKERGSAGINGMLKDCLASLPMIRLMAPNLLGGFFQTMDPVKKSSPENEIKVVFRNIE